MMTHATTLPPDTLTLEFPQGKSHVYPHFKNNDSTLQTLGHLSKILANPDSLGNIKNIKVVGGASPEGSVAINRSLSHHRAENIFRYINQNGTLPDSLTSFSFLGRDWTGLRNLVATDSNVPYREETLSLIDEIIASHPNRSENDNVIRLRKLRSGVPYDYMYSHLFPILRASSIILDYYPLIPLIQIPDFTSSVDIIPGLQKELYPEPLPAPCQQCIHPFYMDLRTNLLFDALILPNIGAEFYLGKNLSIIGNWMYGWWDKDKVHRYWRAYGGDLGVRYWFGKKAHEKPLTGHHVGLYAGVVTYDFEFGGKGYMGGRPSHNLWDRCNFLAGVEYGYSLPVAKHLNIDFTIGLGYLGGRLLEYEPKNNEYVWEKTKHLHWFGPTKAEISLVWLIGCDNYNRKGGK